MKKNDFRNFTYLSVLLLLTSWSQAQKNLQPAFIVTKGNDTVQGFIDYHNWDKNPSTINFYRSVAEKETAYSPSDIMAFKVSGEYYQSAIVTIDDSPYKTEDLKEEVKFNYVNRKVFLLCLINGEKNLYYYIDEKAKTHFFTKNDSTYELLLYKRYLKLDELGDVTVTENKKYIGQLTIYLGDCHGIQDKLRYIKYERKEMVNLFLYYYKCSKRKLKDGNDAFIKHNEMGVLAGVSLTTLKYSNGMNYFTKADFPASTNFTAGIFYNIVLPRNFGRLSIKNEFLYHSFKTTGNYKDIVYTDVGLHYFMITSMARYKFLRQHFNYFFESGFSVGMGFNETNYQKFLEAPLQRAYEGKAFQKLTREFIGVGFGAGLQIKKRYIIESRYVFGIKKSDYLPDKVAIGSVSNYGALLVGYQF